jgi:pyroglutamyl-peptidase
MLRKKRPSASPVLLVTGFGPFENYAENPSGDIAMAVHRRRVAGVHIIGKQVDVGWVSSWEAIQTAVEKDEPDAVLCLGVAPEPFFRFEVMACNSALPCADVFGAVPQTFEMLRIVDDAPPAYWTTLPVDWLRQRMMDRHARLSQDHDATAIAKATQWPDAGSYLCNYVFFNVMHYFRNQVPCRGFVHVPRYPLAEGNGDLPRSETLAAGQFLVEELAHWLVSQPGNVNANEVIARKKRLNKMRS